MFHPPQTARRPRCAIQISVTVLAMVTVIGGCAQWRTVEDRKYATLSAELNRDPEEAAKKHAAALEVMQADNLAAHGDLKEAEALLREALVDDVSFGPAHNSLGVIYLMQGEMYLAAWEFEMAARTMPTLGEPHNNLGLVYESVRRFDDAVKAYEVAMSLDPSNPEYAANLARARLRRGDTPAEVQELLSQVAFQDPRPHWSQWAQRKLMLAGLKVLSTGSPPPWESHWIEDTYEELQTPEARPGQDDLRQDEAPGELPAPRLEFSERPRENRWEVDGPAMRGPLRPLDP